MSPSELAKDQVLERPRALGSEDSSVQCLPAVKARRKRTRVTPEAFLKALVDQPLDSEAIAACTRMFEWLRTREAKKKEEEN